LDPNDDPPPLQKRVRNDPEDAAAFQCTLRLFGVHGPLGYPVLHLSSAQRKRALPYKAVAGLRVGRVRAVLGVQSYECGGVYKLLQANDTRRHPLGHERLQPAWMVGSVLVHILIEKISEIVQMEVLIDDLPIHLQRYIYDMVMELRKPITVLSSDLKHDIESYSLLPHIVHNYRIMFNGVDHMGWVENAIINIMNEHQSIGMGGLFIHIHEDLRRAFPTLTDEEIAVELTEGSHLSRLWRYMPPKKRVDLYLESCEHIF